jgi:hypothetical protein
MRPCPFCGFEHSDFRESHNWSCSECKQDYADWLKTSQGSVKTNARSSISKPVKKAMFSSQEIPEEAQPVKDAQNVMLFGLLGCLLLNILNISEFLFIYPVGSVLLIYMAFRIHQTGFAIARLDLYQREKNPLMFRVHFWGSLMIAGVFLIAWLT